MPTHPLNSLILALVAGGCAASLVLDPPVDEGLREQGSLDDAGGPDRGGLRDAAGVDAAPADGAPADGAPACVDADGDGFGEGCPAGLDCDDQDPARFPGARETCNGLDDDCDGAVDEAWPGLGEACTVGLGACARPARIACAPGGEGVLCLGAPGEPEPERCNRLDDDCDGAVDEGLADCCAAGAVRPCGQDQGRCRVGESRCGPDGSWGACDAPGPQPERCDGIDDDCDGRVDEGCCAADADCGQGRYCHAGDCQPWPSLVVETPHGVGCTDYRAQAPAPPFARRFTVRGRPGARVEQWTEYRSCGQPARVAGPPADAMHLDASGRSTWLAPWSARGCDDLSGLGRWQTWAVVDGRQSEAVTLSLINGDCPGIAACVDAEGYCP